MSSPILTLLRLSYGLYLVCFCLLGSGVMTLTRFALGSRPYRFFAHHLVEYTALLTARPLALNSYTFPCKTVPVTLGCGMLSLSPLGAVLGGRCERLV